MTNLQAALLGVIQGITEFLPISSSAHLILAREVFGWELSRNELPFDVACHLGTLVAVLVYFRNDILAMVKALPKILTDAVKNNNRIIDRVTSNREDSRHYIQRQLVSKKK